MQDAIRYAYWLMGGMAALALFWAIVFFWCMARGIWRRLW
jgi:hypothetical protein